MLHAVDVGRLGTAAYRGIAPEETLNALEDLGRALRGVRVLHVNATPYGGGVSELLRSIVPLLRDLGLVADWRIISGDNDFFDVTKRVHNALQGEDNGLSAEQQQVFERQARLNAAEMQEEYDVVFVHDPQPVALPSLRGRGTAVWVWRCHIDTSQPHPPTWRYLRRFVEPYDAAVFTMEEFVPADLPVPRVEVIPPAIDPLSPKNLPLGADTARQVLNWIGVDPARPLITQVSRFDPWKDPLGVIAAYRKAREHVPGVQLAMAGSMALDDPQGWDIYRRIEEAAGDDPLIHVFTNLTGVGNVEVNAFQSLSRVVVQKSLREGFGLVVSEAMWKGTPVVAGRAGGIPLQTADGVGGVLVDGVEECAKALVDLVSDQTRADDLGRLGRERVRSHFLLPRLVLNELELIRDLLGGRPRPRRLDFGRDPVCGMVLTAEPPPLVGLHGGREYPFCSERCRAFFAQAPEHYLRSWQVSGGTPEA